MKKQTTILLAMVMVVAALLMAARWLLPVMGFAGVEEEWLRPLSQLMPIAAMTCVVSVVMLVITFRWKPKSAYPQAKRLVEEAEAWSDNSIIGNELQQPAFNDASRDAFEEASLMQEPEVAWGFQQFASVPAVSPAIARVAESATICAPRYSSLVQQDLTWQDLTMRENENNPPINQDSGQNGEQDGGKATTVRLNSAETSAIQPVSGPVSMNASPISSATTIEQLPPLLPEFAGRGFELAELVAARANPEHRILSLQGTGGVGKTTLALKLAHQLAPHYPDARIFVDLKGASPQPLSVAEIQAHIIRAYLPAARLPESEAELSKLYTSVLNGKRTLLLLDNAVNGAQIAPLVSPANSLPEGCLIVVTSRQHLSSDALPGMFARRLDTLPPSEAQELLRRLLPRIGEV
ncbi:MAG: NB-ARC domain-containing protein, partial [Blastocatellia bacterium]